MTHSGQGPSGQIWERFSGCWLRTSQGPSKCRAPSMPPWCWGWGARPSGLPSILGCTCSLQVSSLVARGGQARAGHRHVARLSQSRGLGGTGQTLEQRRRWGLGPWAEPGGPAGGHLWSGGGGVSVAGGAGGGGQPEGRGEQVLHLEWGVHLGGGEGRGLAVREQRAHDQCCRRLRALPVCHRPPPPYHPPPPRHAECRGGCWGAEGGRALLPGGNSSPFSQVPWQGQWTLLRPVPRALGTPSFPEETGLPCGAIGRLTGVPQLVPGQA